jgi:hypothetical protein
MKICDISYFLFRRVALAIASTSLAIAPEGATPFEELIPQSFLALYSKLPGG